MSRKEILDSMDQFFHPLAFTRFSFLFEMIFLVHIGGEKLRSWAEPDVIIQGISPIARNNGKILAELNGFCYVLGGDSSDGIISISFT